MDPITQGALGAACSQAILHRYDKKNAWLVGLLAGMAADLDVFIRSVKDPLLFFIYHRHFTHSLSFIPIGASLVTLILILFERFRRTWRLTFLAALIGYSTHGLLDSCTNYGTLLYWPFSDKRVSWDFLSIIDPFITLPLFLGIIWTMINDDRKGVFFGLMFAGSLSLFNYFQHHHAVLAVEAFTQQNHLQLTRLRVFPKMASSIAWRGIAMENHDFLAFNILVPFPFKQQTKVTLVARYPLLQPAITPNYVKDSPSLMRDLAIFTWFSDGYSILANPEPLTLVDGRFLMDDAAKIALWGFQFLPKQEHVKRINFIRIGQQK
ncbi:metal-dependent hydrolase [Legionella lansingensis]|nr:metal-dependent hydrolase [Legionella lansingensis]